MPLDPRLGADELRRIVHRARPSVVIASERARDCGEWTGTTVLGFDRLATLADGPDADVARGPDDAALVVWTSGTTAAPKGVTLSFANVAYVVDQGRAAHHLTDTDRWLSILPLNHMIELSCGLLPALASGASFDFLGTSDPAQVGRGHPRARHHPHDGDVGVAGRPPPGHRGWGSDRVRTMIGAKSAKASGPVGEWAKLTAPRPPWPRQ